MQSNLLKTGLHKLLSLRVILSVLLFIDGVMILSPVLFSYTGDIAWQDGGFTAWLQSLGFIKLLDIPRFMLGLLLALLALLMLTGARIAWLFSLFILLTMVLMDLGLAGILTAGVILAGAADCVRLPVAAVPASQPDQCRRGGGQQYYPAGGLFRLRHPVSRQ